MTVIIQWKRSNSIISSAFIGQHSAKKRNFLINLFSYLFRCRILFCSVEIISFILWLPLFHVQPVGAAPSDVVCVLCPIPTLSAFLTLAQWDLPVHLAFSLRTLKSAVSARCFGEWCLEPRSGSAHFLVLACKGSQPSQGTKGGNTGLYTQFGFILQIA